jgi:hypothetical protein
MVDAAAVRSNDIFISYSRRDKSFAQKLVAAFQSHQRDPWIDWEDIADAQAWRTAIATGIQQSDTFIFVISPSAIASEECRKELDQAIKYKKQIIPIVYKETPTVHSELSALQWIFFRDQDDFTAAFQKLLTAVNTDLRYKQLHTRWLNRALEWEDGRDDGSLLRGKELNDAEQWMEKGSPKGQAPTDLHCKYITRSREVENAAQRLALMGRKATRIWALSVVACVLSAVGIAIAVYVTQQRVNALNQEQERLAQTIEQKTQEINKLSSIMKQLDQDRTRLLNELRKYGWSEEKIAALLNSSDLEIATRVAEVRDANQTYQKTLKDLNQSKAATPDQPAPAASPKPPDSGAAASEPTPSPEPTPPITIEFPVQGINPTPIAKAFRKLGLTPQTIATRVPADTNVIYYGKDVDPNQVRAVAYALIRAGTVIRGIQPFDPTDSTKVASIQVGNLPDFQDKPPLTVEEIRDKSLPLP